ncbi:MAG: dynamin family protein [Campylobacteraceae bacterium]
MSGLFREFIEEFKNFDKKEVEAKSGILKLITKASSVFLFHDMLPSNELIEAINKLKQRSSEPMKVAITGQFSSGKSTFLNALLSKNILPTGITPVTSKVNYIRYADDYSMQVKYKDGREAFYSIENIANFTDQRGEVEDVEYLTLFAPLPLLRDVVFVDTPGLNSQSSSDTEVTEKVLKEVDGIIWLTLIDNAGKMSEAEVLEEYMNAYQNKSLCVLNQKDKFTPEQIEETTNYVKNAFKKYFSEVIPISARDALKSRSNQIDVMLESSLEKDILELQKNIKEANFEIKKELLEKFTNAFLSQKQDITSIDTTKNAALLKESNIEAVLEFIYNEIQPIATTSRDFAITKDIENMATTLIEQEDKILGVFTELENILITFEKEAGAKFEELKKRFAKALNESFSKIEEIMEKIANEIFLHVSKSERVRFAKQTNRMFSKKESFTPFSYDAPKINSDEVYKKLFFDDDLIGKMFKQYLRTLNAIQEEVNEENAKVFQNIEEKIKEWQKPHEIMRKTKALQSDKQFANIRKFASKTYENILKPYNDEIASSYAKISSEFKHLSATLKFNYQNATEVVIAFLERKIEKSINLYEENPTQFSIYQPKLDDIRDRLKISFYMYELENMMQDKKSFVSKNYDRLIEEFVKIKEDRLRLIQENKNDYVKLKKEIEGFKNTL